MSALLAVIIVAIAVANGFRYQIRDKASGFSGDITLSAPGVDILDYLYPVEAPVYLSELNSLKEVESVGGVAYRSGILKSEDLIQGAIFKGVDSLYNKKFYGEHLLCGHNIKEFDIPYICRRMVIHRIPLPGLLDLSGKKPWETPLIDTMEMWKFGDKKSFTALKLLTAIFGLPTPKDDIDGSQVAQVYYGEHDLPRIAVYCEKDVVATAQVFLRLNQLPGIPPENVEHR